MLTMEDIEVIIGIICFIALIMVAGFIVPMLFAKNYSVMCRTKLALALLLLVCAFPWTFPYDVYILVRFVAMVVFAVMAYQYYIKKSEALMVVFGALALLFQPLLKISLERVAWSCIDVAVAGLIIYLLWKEGLRL